MSRPLAHLALAAIAMLGVACSTHPVHVRTDHDASRNVAAYRTFGFYQQSSTDSVRYQTLLTAHLQAATRQQMESRGYVFTKDKPQLLVNFLVNVRQQQEAHGAPAGYAVRPAYRGLGGYNIDTVTTKQGTVTIDVVDAASQSIVWQGVGEGVVPQKAERSTSTTVNTAVTEIFRGFPASKAL
jgi:hypothetical protein